MQIFKRYMREGPGVEPDEPRKRGIALYFEVLFQKFFKLMRANILYFIAGLPFFAIILFFIAPIYSGILLPPAYGAGSYANIVLNIFLTILIYNFLGSGPASAAYSYVIKCFTQGKIVFIASDGFGKFRENFKNAILLALTDIAVLIVFATAINFYKGKTELLTLWMLFFVSGMLIFYILSHSFAYHIMINFECSFGGVLKNAFIFTIAKLPMCILLGGLSAGIIYLMINYLSFFAIPIYIIAGITFTKFPLELYASEVIRDYIQEKR